MVTTAATGEEALVILKRENTIELVVTDYRMPGMNGFELFRQAQQIRYVGDLGESPVPQFILMTGIRPPTSGPTREMELIDSAKEFGFVEVFHKPIDRNLFLEQVTTLERRKRPLPGGDLQSATRNYSNLLNDIGRIVNEVVQCTDSSVVEELAKQLRDWLAKSDDRLTALNTPRPVDPPLNHQAEASSTQADLVPVAEDQNTAAPLTPAAPLPVEAPAQSV
jgi:CheY-like chemotaxis protein